MNGFLKNLFGGGQKQPAQNEAKRDAAPPPRPLKQALAELYNKGDVIGGKYEVQGLLGKGGFGVVYLVYARDAGEVCALKTFRDELLANPAARETFKKECLLWVQLEEHPYILAARWVSVESGRLFVRMDYVAPDAQRRVNLGDHLVGARLNTNQVLQWAIQFCLGMEHARAHGIESHRDIKPANILITKDGTLKVSDFGLSLAAEAAWRGAGDDLDSLVTGEGDGNFSFSLIRSAGKRACGTPGYIAPEVLRSEGSTVRSDIYSFGLVLWQMATGSQTPPFMVKWRGNMEIFLREIYDQQMSCALPFAQVELGRIIARCLKPKPAERYEDFAELRKAIQSMWEGKTGKKFETHKTSEKTSADWNNKGGSLNALGRHEEAIKCYDRALAIDPDDAAAWNNKGSALLALCRYEDASRCLERAVTIDPLFAMAGSNWGLALAGLHRHTEAIKCFDHALLVDSRHIDSWNNKGVSLEKLGRHEEAISCYDKVISIDPRHIGPWANKGRAFTELGHTARAIACYDKALAIDPLDSKTWANKGAALFFLKEYEKAIHCFDKALALGDNDSYTWYNKGVSHDALGQHEQENHCYDKALAINPRHVGALINKGCAFNSAERYEEAIHCYERALAADAQNAAAWCNKGDTLDNMARHEESIDCYTKGLAIAPSNIRTWNDKGRVLAKLNRHQERIACYDQALAIDPHAAYVWFNKGNALAALERREEAINCYIKALALEPGDMRVWHNKAVAERNLGRVRDAIASYRKFIDLAPPEDTKMITQARQRLQELEAKLGR